MVRILTVLGSFTGLNGAVVNERRIARCVANNSKVQHVYVLTLLNYLDIFKHNKYAVNEKLSVISFPPRIPCPLQSLYMLQMVGYGFILALFSLLLKKSGLIDSIYVRGSFLAFGFISLRRFIGSISIKVVSSRIKGNI